mmetsp:Transcript_29539/g.85472  ORF Transcript_29539/g.85472 Transcript_29539/m.85472 type:complete len:104 (+) Transcript_29539:2835-3146(+)
MSRNITDMSTMMAASQHAEAAQSTLAAVAARSTNVRSADSVQPRPGPGQHLQRSASAQRSYPSHRSRREYRREPMPLPPISQLPRQHQHRQNGAGGLRDDQWS